MDDKSLLTFEEISYILYDATDSQFEIVNLIHPGFKKTDIMRISLDKKLILFKGNEHTGYQHIYDRHNPIMKGSTWSQSGSLNESTKFSFNHTPIFYYLIIGEAIYCPKNLNLEKNTRPDSFDLYIGSYTDPWNITNSYRLLLYKDTKIIHNLFPEQRVYRKFKPVNGFNLRQGSTGFTYNVVNTKITYKFKFFDSNLVPRVTVSVETNQHLKTEIWNYDILDQTEKVLKTIEFANHTKETFMDMHDRVTNLTYVEDLTQLKISIRNELAKINNSRQIAEKSDN